jgi:hypothetical protein
MKHLSDGEAVIFIDWMEMTVLTAKPKSSHSFEEFVAGRGSKDLRRKSA